MAAVSLDWIVGCRHN
uniref:Uncharacterized protein n=1 Tax=Anguilla anguilla TaxID=7936 RepID=A0A0E9VUF6_ANGAN